jgi:hypothetical protein
MTNSYAFKLMCKALASAAFLGVAGFLYYLWACGLPVRVLLIALGMAFFVSAMTVAGAVIVLRSKEQ